MNTHHSFIRVKRFISLLFLSLISTALTWGQITVKGTVIDETQFPVAGANVLVKGENTGVITDLDGNFSIQVPKKSSILVFSFIGFATQEVTVGNKTQLNIVLKEDGVMLNEVVAIGYATVKKSDLTGSVEKVDMEDLNKTSSLSFDQALGGRVAGVQVVSSDVFATSYCSIVCE